MNNCMSTDNVCCVSEGKSNKDCIVNVHAVHSYTTPYTTTYGTPYMEQFVRNYCVARGACCAAPIHINAISYLRYRVQTLHSEHAIRKLMWINKGNKWNKSQCSNILWSRCVLLFSAILHLYAFNNWAGDSVSVSVCCCYSCRLFHNSTTLMLLCFFFWFGPRFDLL